MEHKLSTARSDLEEMLSNETAEPKALTLSLLEDITGGFCDENEIGSGGFAVVYKGKLNDKAVAVKRLSKAYMHEMEFHREVQCLMLVKHKNVVRFLGYCADTQGNMAMYDGKLVMADVQQRLLCFEYMPKGSLDKYITGACREWGTCYKIIKGICEGLLYLHENHIVHLDLKPANILLDDNMVPKIADFGLSRCFEENQSQYITRTIVGTPGYLAPEFHERGVITRSTDLYSLGVIIIEILTGQRGYQSIRDVLEGWSNRLRSQGNTECEQIRVCYEIGLECIDFIPDKRPASARDIIDRLLEMGSPQNLGSAQTAEAAASTSEAAAAMVIESKGKSNNSAPTQTAEAAASTSGAVVAATTNKFKGRSNNDLPRVQSQCSGCGPAPPGPPTPTPPAPTPPAPPGDGVASIVSSDLFERLLLHRNDAACPSRGFYTYDAFIAAAASFPGFGTTGSTEARKREVAAFLAQTSHETTGGWLAAPDGPYSWGYCYKQEHNAVADYCVPSTEWPCAPGKKYYGRGPIQLSYNYNYGPAGRAIGVDLLNNPDLVATDPVVSFKTALWFWTTPQAPKPSCHAVITGQWSPTPSDSAAGRVPGYGVITNIINGGIECRIGPDARVADRIGFYKRYCDVFGISYGTNLDCYSQLPFNRGLSLAAAQ